MNSTLQNNWDGLKHRARIIELEIESKLQNYGKNNSSKSFESTFEIETSEIKKLLEELNDIIQFMSDYCSSHAQDINNRTNIGVLQRTREIYTENSSTFKRLLNLHRQSINSKQLFSSSASNSGEIDRNSATAITDTMLRERSTLSSTHKAIDSILEEANSTKEALNSQRTSFLNTNQRLNTIFTSLPVVGNLMSSIQQRRTSNQTILSIVIASGIFFFLYWFILRHI